VAYVCRACGERRPRGYAMIRTGGLADDLRADLEWRGFEIVESPYVYVDEGQVKRSCCSTAASGPAWRTRSSVWSCRERLWNVRI